MPEKAFVRPEIGFHALDGSTNITKSDIELVCLHMQLCSKDDEKSTSATTQIHLHTQNAAQMQKYFCLTHNAYANFRIVGLHTGVHVSLAVQKFAPLLNMSEQV